MASDALDTLPTWLTLFICIAPIVIGMRLGLWVAYFQTGASWTLAVMTCGIGGISGYLLLAAIIYALDIAYLQAFAAWLLYGLSGLAAIILLQVAFAGLSQSNVLRTNTPPVSYFSLLILMPPIFLLAGGLYVSIWEPVSGWDSLTWFVRNSAHFIEQETTSLSAPSPFIYPDNDSYIHPITTTLVAGFSGWVASLNQLNLGVMLPWHLAWMCLALISFGFVSWICENVTIGLLSSITMLSLPLVENHSLVAGYTELWLAAVTLSSAALLAAALMLNSRIYLLLGILFAFINSSIKSSGFIYGLCLVSALFFAFWWHKSRIMFSALLVTAFVSACFFYSIGFHFELFGYTFAVEHDPSSGNFSSTGEMLNRYSSVEHVGTGTRVSLAGRTWTPTIAPLSSVIENEIHALMINSSFSNAFIGLIIVVLLRGAGLASVDSRQNLSVASTFLMLSTVFILVCMMLSQLVFDYAFDLATPDSDTGNSRFTLPGAVLAVLAIYSVTPTKSVARRRSSLL